VQLRPRTARSFSCCKADRTRGRCCGIPWLLWLSLRGSWHLLRHLWQKQGVVCQMVSGGACCNAALHATLRWKCAPKQQHTLRRASGFTRRCNQFSRV
jgi:hypothetical protein